MDVLDFQTRSFLVNTENPVDKLKFYKKENESKPAIDKERLIFILSKIIMLIFTVMLLLGSVFLNSLVFLSDKCYVVTIGEYGNMEIAKNEAIKFLPELKQIHITELDSGIYTLEIEKLSSKTEAYKLAQKLTEQDFDSVHVRHLPER